MPLPEDTTVFMTVEAYQENTIPKQRSLSLLFTKMVQETITIEVNKPAVHSSDFLNYLVNEIENAVDRYEE